MSDVKRYNCVTNDHDAIELNAEGGFVKFDDYEKRVNGQLRLLEVSGRYNDKLETRVGELEAQIEFEMNEKAKARKQRDVCAKRIAELETNIHNIMYENMTLNVKVVGFERKTQEILDAINEGEA